MMNNLKYINKQNANCRSLQRQPSSVSLKFGLTYRRRCNRQCQGNSSQQNTQTLPENLQTIVTGFQMVPDPMARYKQLLFYATKLPQLDEQYKTEEYKVQGCVSQVWVHSEVKDDGNVYFSADSDAALTKGLAALLVRGLSGTTPQSIIDIQPSFIEQLGLAQSLTPSRNNGFLNMFKLMQRRCLTHIADAA